MQLRLKGKDDSKQGALMHVAVDGAQARVILLPSDPASTQAAVDFIAQVDPPSQGVPMRQVILCQPSVLNNAALDLCLTMSCC